MDHYFLIETKLGKTYLTQLHNEKLLNLNVETIEGEEVLVNAGVLELQKFIVLQDPIVMVPRRNQDGSVQTIPVRIAEAPMGSTRVVLAVDVIAEINILDSSSDFVTQIKASQAGLYAGGSQAEIENSSRLIHKFSKR